MMKKIVWCLPFLLMLLLVLRHGEQTKRQTNQIPPLSSRAIGWLIGTDMESTSSRGGMRSNVDDGIPLGPNLSTCHTTFSEPQGWPGHYLNCCPSRPDSEQPIVDFELPSQSSPIRLRRPAHRVTDDQDYLAKYNKAVAIMKQLPPAHPHSWNRQANIHCLYCTGSYYRANDTTPFNIHNTWLFFPFHRYYVYFHERILGKLIGDDTFALPYWSWDSPDGMPIPSIYLEGSLHDEERESSHLPPKVADLSYAWRESGMTPAAQIATNLALMYNNMVSGATKPELFMGSKLRSCRDGECSEAGTIEQAPHNTLHFWVGNSSKPEVEHMGTFYAAARDPVFYAHHANIDRMWHLWRKHHGYRGSEPEFDDPQWLDSYFYFYDENLNLVRVKVRDSIDIDKLRYAYEEIDLPWLDARPKPSIPPKIAHNILRTGKSDNVLRMPTNKGPWTLEKTVRVRVTRPTRRRTSTEEEEVLNVYGISIDTDMYVKFDVYINVVDETMASPKSREYAGCFVKMKGGGAVMKGKQNVKLGISEILKDLEADEDESIWVSLVPRAGTGNMTTVDGISIEYME